MSYAAVVSVDNHREDPDVGRRGLREELAAAMKQFPGFESGLFLTAYERCRRREEPVGVRSPHLGAHEVVDARPRRPPFRRVGTGDDQPPGAGRGAAGTAEAAPTCAVSSARDSRAEREKGDVISEQAQSPVGNRVGGAGDEMGDVGRGPRSDPVHRAQPAIQRRDVGPRRPGRAGPRQRPHASHGLGSAGPRHEVAPLPVREIRHHRGRRRNDQCGRVSRITGRRGSVPPHQSLPRPPRSSTEVRIVRGSSGPRCRARIPCARSASPAAVGAARRRVRDAVETRLVRRRRLRCRPRVRRPRPDPVPDVSIVTAAARGSTARGNVTGPAGEFSARRTNHRGPRLVGSKRPRVNMPNVSDTSIGSGHGNVRVATGTRRSYVGRNSGPWYPSPSVGGRGGAGLELGGAERAAALGGSGWPVLPVRAAATASPSTVSCATRSSTRRSRASR